MVLAARAVRVADPEVALADPVARLTVLAVPDLGDLVVLAVAVLVVVSAVRVVPADLRVRSRRTARPGRSARVRPAHRVGPWCRPDRCSVSSRRPADAARWTVPARAVRSTADAVSVR